MKEGYSLVNVTTGVYADGPITILATPDSGYLYGNMIINSTSTTTNPYTFTLAGDTTIEVYFTKDNSKSGCTGEGDTTRGGGGGGTPSGEGGSSTTGRATTPDNPVPPDLSFQSLYQNGAWFLIIIVLAVVLIGESRGNKKNCDRWSSGGSSSVSWGGKKGTYD